jgi:glycerol uptake facilitator-like aquaporin
MVPKYVIEFIGTFLFLSVILNTGKALPIAVALAAVIYFGGSYGNNHYNPAVTFMSWNKGDTSTEDAGFNVVAQLLGAYSAYWFYTNTNKKSMSMLE